MRRLIFSLLCLVLISTCIAQNNIPVALSNAKNATEIVENSNSSFKFNNTLANFSISRIIENGEIYSKILVDGYVSNNKVGMPQLPVIVKTIEVPMGAEIVPQVNINSEQVINISELGIENQIVPCQPAFFKSMKKEDLPFTKDKIYQEAGVYAPDAVTIEEAGVVRGIRLVKIVISPFVYDIADNSLTIRENISVNLTFKNAKTNGFAAKTKLYTPVFDAVYKNIWNYKKTRNAEMHYPIKYVIVADRMFEEALLPFIAWKTKKGFLVETAYTDEIGRTDATIQPYLKGLYENATAENPAPSYVLLVGDTAQISVTWSKLSHSGGGFFGDSNDHYTDVYKFCFDGANDYIPDMFYGRFSAKNVAELTPQIEKSLMFEQFTFADASYLQEAVLVAGYDQTIQYDDINGNGQINYLTTYYANSDEMDVNVTKYLSPESHTSGNAIKTKISEGVGFVNYSAHCDENGWQDPEFNRTDVSNLNNDGEYFFSIGNCCLSNKFDVDECFGEALLRKPGKGAVCHIGGTNSTIWDEDFYWTVGVMSQISANPTYEQTTQAVYDHLFHKRGETPIVSAGEIVFTGNFSVNSATNSNYIQYYWEIYTLMGDPSLMPYIGLPQQLTTEHSTFLPVGSSEFAVTAEDISLVALSKDGVLLDAQYTGASNTANLQFDALTESGELDLVITRQFREPYFATIMVIAGSNENDVAMQTIVAPAQEMSEQDATFAPKAKILNIGTAALTSATVSYTIDQQPAVSVNWTGNLAQYESAEVSFEEITLQTGSYNFEFTVSQPNGQNDADVSNNSKTRTVNVSSGNVTIMSVSEPNGNYCGYAVSRPTINVKNASNFVVTSLTANYTCGSLSAEKTFSVNIPAGGTAELVFDAVTIPEGEGTISFVVSHVNGGLNQTQTPKQAAFNIESHSGEGFRLDLMADYNADQTWEIIDADNNVVVEGTGGSYTGTVISTDFCLPAGCYTFNLNSASGSGLSGMWGILGMGSATFTNLNTNEVLLNVEAESFTTKTIEFCVEGTTGSGLEGENIVSVYPNPANEMFVVTNAEGSDIEVVNALGQVVVKVENASSNQVVNTNGLSNGTYFVKVGAEVMKINVVR